MLNCIKSVEEKARFSLLFQIVGEDCRIESDGKTFLIAQSYPTYPVWVWTKKRISKAIILKVKEKMRDFVGSEKVKFTCSKEFYDRLKIDRFDILTEDYFEMGAYYCKKTIKPRKVSGRLSQAIEEDIDVLAAYYMRDNKEIKKTDITIAEAKKFIVEKFTSKTLYVWKDDANKIVCTATIRETGPFVRISHVYTPEEERCKGYAKNLIYALTKKELKEGFIPVLYTDFNYPASNKAYISVGYEDVGMLINFSCEKKVNIKA